MKLNFEGTEKYIDFPLFFYFSYIMDGFSSKFDVVDVFGWSFFENF